MDVTSHRVKAGWMLISRCIIFYLCSTYIVHRPSSILCATTALFSPSRFAAPSLPPKLRNAACKAAASQSNATPYNACILTQTGCVRGDTSVCPVHLHGDFRVNHPPPPSSLVFLPRILFVAVSREHRSSVHRHYLQCHPHILLLRQRCPETHNEPSKPCESGWPCRWWRASRSPCQWPKWPGHR
jgi:hypothetical protein